MNIENLSDTELELAMLWLYPPSHQIRYTQYSDGSLKGCYHAALQAAFYSYLTVEELNKIKADALRGLITAIEGAIENDFISGREVDEMELDDFLKLVDKHANRIEAGE